ncbi:type II toxin-antitoxin system RelE/ParE family toxin [Aestuariibius sp. 2305UL40-4]|uniref:type II toxin-antitoxin system RelE/ParE family toxin n=1 Tax=Aestuariibius violaceus TaxID=3234132 RepID=UPI00345EE8F9
MTRLTLTRDAETDFTEITLYTIERFCLDQAERYTEALWQRCLLLAEHPGLGRRYEVVREGLLRAEYERHSIYYRSSSDGILVYRILHQRRDPARHL